MSEAPQHSQDTMREDGPHATSLPSLVLPSQPFAGGLPLDLDLDAPAPSADAGERARLASLPSMPDLSAPTHGAATDSPVDHDTAAAAIAGQIGLGAFHEAVQDASDRRTADRGTPDRRTEPRPYASPWMARPEGGALDPRPQHEPAATPDVPLTPIDTRVPDLPVPALEQPAAAAPTEASADLPAIAPEPLAMPDVVPARAEAQAVAAPAGDILASVFDVGMPVGAAMASPAAWYAGTPEAIAAALAPEPEHIELAAPPVDTAIIVEAAPPAVKPEVIGAPPATSTAGILLPNPAEAIDLPPPGALPAPVAGSALNLPPPAAPGIVAPVAAAIALPVLPAPPTIDPASLLPAPEPVYTLPAPEAPAQPGPMDVDPYMAEMIAAHPAMADLAARGGLAMVEPHDATAERPVYAPWNDVRPSMTSVAEVMTTPALYDVPTTPLEPAPLPMPMPGLAEQVSAATPTPVAVEGQVVIDPALLSGAAVGSYLPAGIELGTPIAEFAPGSVTAAEHLAAHPRSPGLVARTMWLFVIPAASGIAIGELLWTYMQSR